MVSNAPVQRLRRGARISACYPVKALPPLSALDSAFQLQEYVSLLIRRDPHDVARIVAVPDADVAVDEACWIYEHLRRLAQDLSHPLISVLQQECTRATCPEMKAGEWLYLCVAHGNDGAMEQCCAIDYIVHTLDSATALLNSPRVFPSRLQIPPTSHRHFSSLARRLSRVFAHAYYHHRDAFEQAEAESSLYARFLALSARFALVPPEFLVIPPRPPPAEPTLPPARAPADEAELAPLALAPDRAPSPRRPGGRSRTDTMVFSDAQALAEELSRADDDPVARAVVEAHAELAPPPPEADIADGPEDKAEEEAPAPAHDESVLSAEAALHADEDEATDPFADELDADAEDDAADEPEAAEEAPAAPRTETAQEPEAVEEGKAETESGVPVSTEASEEPVPSGAPELPAAEEDAPTEEEEKEEKPTGLDAAVAEAAAEAAKEEEEEDDAPSDEKKEDE